MDQKDGVSSKEVRGAVVHCEARKIAMTHDKNGIVIKLAIHPDDFPHALMETPLGQRYLVAFVQVGDDEKPVTPKIKKEIDRVLAIAQTLPRNERFQRWLLSRGEVPALGEDHAAEALKRLLHIDSRADLATNSEARVLLLDLRGEFDRDVREGRS